MTTSPLSQTTCTPTPTPALTPPHLSPHPTRTCTCISQLGRYQAIPHAWNSPTSVTSSTPTPGNASNARTARYVKRKATMYVSSLSRSHRCLCSSFTVSLSSIVYRPSSLVRINLNPNGPLSTDPPPLRPLTIWYSRVYRVMLHPTRHASYFATTVIAVRVLFSSPPTPPHLAHFLFSFPPLSQSLN